eukprot:9471519-Pyramimonas_sp.AAC.1
MPALSHWQLLVDNPGLLGYYSLSSCRCGTDIVFQGAVAVRPNGGTAEVVMSMMMAFPMTATTLFLNSELALASKPELITQYYALELLPCLLKTIFGGVSDYVPMFGYRRRPYMFFGAIFSAMLYIAMGQAVTTYYEMCIIGILTTLFFTIAETGADGAL